MHRVNMEEVHMESRGPYQGEVLEAAESLCVDSWGWREELCGRRHSFPTSGYNRTHVAELGVEKRIAEDKHQGLGSLKGQ